MRSLALAAVTHAKASLDVLERVAYLSDDLDASLARLRSEVGIRDAAILSTCNRTEVYAVFDGPADPMRLAWFLARDRGLCWKAIEGHVDLYTADDAVGHLFRVAVGVDSLSFGEAEIVAQIKAVRAKLEGSSRHGLLGLFEAAVSTSRAVRARVDVSEGSASLGEAAVAAARPAGGARILVVGAGKIARSVLAALPGDVDVVVTSRTFESAKNLARERARAVAIGHFAGELAAADAAFFCASSRHPILDERAAVAVTTTRRSPLVAVDLGLPRNVAAEVRHVPGIEVIDLEGLRTRTDGARRIRTLTEVEPLIAGEVARYAGSTRARSAGPLIDEVRSAVNAIADAELARSFAGDDPERQRAARLLHRVAGRLLHDVITEIRRAATDEDGEALDVLARAFGIEPPTNVVPQGSSHEEVA